MEAFPFLKFVSSDPARQSVVDSIVPKAVDRVERGDFGGVVWHSTVLDEVEFAQFALSFNGRFLQRLNATRIIGWRRLGANILLEFTEDLPADWDEKNALWAPKAVVHVHVSVPGPREGYFTSYVAHRTVETIAAICTFSLGRSIALPPMVFPSNPEMVSQLAARQTDREILTLARKGNSLDIFDQLGAAPGGDEVFAGIRAALMTYDAAGRQESDSVASILYVAAAECLTTPNAKWRREKLTKRFIEFFDELMPTELDQIVAHEKFEEVFGIRRGDRTPRALRRELLDNIYDYRSGLLHEGLRPTYVGLGVSVDFSDTNLRGFLADFAGGAILQYLAAPRVSLIGHPGLEAKGTTPLRTKGAQLLRSLGDFLRGHQ
jgi:hypothetical protein